MMCSIETWKGLVVYCILSLGSKRQMSNVSDHREKNPSSKIKKLKITSRKYPIKMSFKFNPMSYGIRFDRLT